MLKKHFAIALLLSLLLTNPAPSPTKYDIDAAHSTVGFAIPILGGLSKVKGKFSDFTVTVIHDEADITKSSVSATIKATSIDTGIERRDAHLRNADFFDVEKYPEITFQSKRVEKKGNQLIAHGTFTMHGVSKEVALPFTITGKVKNPATNKTSLGIAATMTVNRRDYGITWQNANVPNWVGDEVEIELNLITKPT